MGKRWGRLAIMLVPAVMMMTPAAVAGESAQGFRQQNGLLAYTPPTWFLEGYFLARQSDTTTSIPQIPPQFTVVEQHFQRVEFSDIKDEWFSSFPSETFEFLTAEVNSTYVFYHARLLGGVVFFAGMLIMAYNCWRTIAGGSPADQRVMSPQTA